MLTNELKNYIKDNFFKEGKLKSTTSKSYLNKNHKKVYDFILDRTNYLVDAKFSERIYHILNDIMEVPICEHPECSNELKFYTFAKPYRKTCSNKCGVFANKLVKFEKYGDENYNNTIKSLQTKIDNDSYNKMIKTHKATCVEKYGVEHHWLDAEIQNKKKNNFIEKYGVDNPMKVKEIQDKTKKTNLERYGVENVSHNQDIKDKIQYKQLNLTDDEKLVKELKRQQTCILKYGVSHQMQTGLYMTSGYKWKEYITPDENILKIQGFENYLLDELLLEYKEDEFIIQRKNMPPIWYIGIDGKKHRYFPDAYVPSTNTIYEVKSEYTLNVGLETNNLKFQAVKDAGYNFVLKVY